MKDLYQIASEQEIHLEDYIDWQIHYPQSTLKEFAEANFRVQDAFKYAAIFYPKFILVEGQVVLEDHYEKKNWDEWRKRLNAKETANIVNHIHIEFYVREELPKGLEDGFAELLIFFWSLAIKKQFPEKRVRVSYNGDQIDIINE